MKVLLINSVCGVMSTGRICLEKAKILENEGHQVKIAYGREKVPEEAKKYAVKIGTDMDQKFHGIATRLLDKHGLASKKVTEQFIAWADRYNPDMVWLHNIHGYYLNYEILFSWIKSRPDMQVRWTLHDCWSFTGHCSHFEMAGCEKWKTGCSSCPQKKEYPSSALIDNSRDNYNRKKASFSGVKNMTIITPCKWMANLVTLSFLKEYEILVEYNTIDTNVFYPREQEEIDKIRVKYGLGKNRIFLGVASSWTKNKGLEDFVKLAELIKEKNLEETTKIVLVGLRDKQIEDIEALNLPIIGIRRTDSKDELAVLYSAADSFLNPTYADNYPSVNLEAEACGTKVITYRTGGAPETLHRDDSKVIDVGDYRSLLQ